MDAAGKADRSSGNTSKPESAVRGAKPSAAVPTGGAPAYNGAEGVPMQQPIPVPAHMMPYYGQYAAMYAMPPGGAPMGFPMQQPPNAGGPPMWMPGMMPPPQGGNPNQPMAPQPYPAPYGAGAQPLMYMPMPYSYPPYMQAPAPNAMSAPFAGQPAKPPAQGAAPPYGANPTAAGAGAAAAAPPPVAAPPHPHPAPAEPAMLSPPTMQSPASPSTVATATAPPPAPAVAAAAAAAAAPPVPAVTPIEYVVMPLMPNTKLPPGDPFCPAGVTVSPQYATPAQYARTSAVPDRAMNNGIHKPLSPAPSTAKSEATSAAAAAATTPATVTA